MLTLPNALAMRAEKFCSKILSETYLKSKTNYLPEQDDFVSFQWHVSHAPIQGDALHQLSVTFSLKHFVEDMNPRPSSSVMVKHINYFLNNPTQNFKLYLNKYPYYFNTWIRCHIFCMLTDLPPEVSRFKLS